MSKPQSKIELEPASKPIPDYLTKEFLETFEDVARFKGWYRQPSNKERRPCIVSHDLFDLITEGDTASPLIQVGDNKPMAVPIIDFDRKQEGLDMLYSTFNTATVVI